MVASALPCGSELYVFQQNGDGKIMDVKLSKEYFEEGEQSVMGFLKVVVDVIKRNGIMLLEWTVKSMYMAQVYNLYTWTCSMAEQLVKQVTLTIYYFLLFISY